MVKQFSKEGWHNKTADVVDARSTTSSDQSFGRHPKSSLLLATNVPTSSLTRFDTSTLFSTLLSLAAPTCVVCYDPAHSTLCCPLLPREALHNIAAVCTRHLRAGKTGDGGQRPPSPKRRFNNNRRYFSSGDHSSSGE